MHDKLLYLLPPGPQVDCPLEPQDLLERQAARRWYLYVHRRQDLQRLVLPAELDGWRTCHLQGRFSLWQWQGGQFQDLIHPQQAAATSWSHDLQPGDTVLAWGGEAALELMSYDILSPEQAPPRDWARPAPGLEFSRTRPARSDKKRQPAAACLGRPPPLAQLSRLLQALFGWRGHHQFFLSHGRRFQTMEADHYDEYLPFEEEVFLYQLLEPGRTRLLQRLRPGAWTGRGYLPGTTWAGPDAMRKLTMSNPLLWITSITTCGWPSVVGWARFCWSAT